MRIGVGLSASAPSALMADPTLGASYDLRSPVLPPGLTFSRPSAKTGIVNGLLVQYESGVAAISVANGYFGENEARTNFLRNSMAVGAIGGDPGTAPNNVYIAAVGGLSKSIVASGIENGFSYYDVRFYGTPAATGPQCIIQFDSGNTQIPAVSGEIWTSSFYSKIVSGDLTNVSSVRNVLIGRNSAGSSVESTITAYTLSNTMDRNQVTRTMVDATVAYITNSFYGYVTAGLPVDFTIRIAAAQLEKGEGATSFIPTTTSAATRAADVLYATPAINATEGMLIAEYVENIDFSASRWTRAALLTDGTTNNTIDIYNAPGFTNHMLYEKSGGTKYSEDVVGNAGVGSVTKWGLAYSPSGISGCINGGTVVTKAVTPPVGLNRLIIAGNAFCGNVRRLQVHTARNDEKMRALTTLAA